MYAHTHMFVLYIYISSSSDKGDLAVIIYSIGTRLGSVN